ncbi:MAG: TraR/DksA C4-type zinc finger protein, partial [Acidobacteriota bacterium]
LGKLKARLEDEERGLHFALSAVGAMIIEKTFDEWQTRNEADYQTALQHRLKRIEEALLRVGRGGYGLCVKCNEKIDNDRLEKDPAASLCRDCSEVTDISTTN